MLKTGLATMLAVAATAAGASPAVPSQMLCTAKRSGDFTLKFTSGTAVTVVQKSAIEGSYEVDDGTIVILLAKQDNKFILPPSIWLKEADLSFDILPEGELVDDPPAPVDSGKCRRGKGNLPSR